MHTLQYVHFPLLAKEGSTALSQGAPSIYTFKVSHPTCKYFFCDEFVK